MDFDGKQMEKFHIKCKKCSSYEVKIDADNAGISLECQACGEWEWYKKFDKNLRKGRRK